MSLDLSVLLQESDKTFVTATKQPPTWNAVLASLKTISAPVPQGTRVVVGPMEHVFTLNAGSKLSDVAFNVSAVTGDAIALHPSAVGRTLPLIDRVAIEGGRQTVDGFEWRDVTFIGTHISYRGGVVKLEGVRFVNCTFDLPPDPRGAKLAQYVALTLPNLNLGPATS